MTKLKELEKRLRDEPENLGLRVMVAGAMHEAGRRGDAVELYRSVAIAYRDQGRSQQAIQVCRSVLELAPDDAACAALLHSLLAAHGTPPAGATLVPQPLPPVLDAPDDSAGWKTELTPLPAPLPYHEAEPTMGSMPALTPADLPPTLREELAGIPQILEIASAAEQISATLIAAQRTDEDDDKRDAAARLEPVDDEDEDEDDSDLTHVADDVPRISLTAFTTLVAHDDASDDESEEVTNPAHDDRAPVAIPEDDKTTPHMRLDRAPSPVLTNAPSALTSPLFAAVPSASRAAVLQRFRSRNVVAGSTVIRRGETGHGLVLVVRGMLELRAERPSGASAVIAAIAPGDFVGEVSLLSRAPSATQVVALIKSELLILAPADFYEVITTFPALHADLKDVAARRTREHAERLDR